MKKSGIGKYNHQRSEERIVKYDMAGSGNNSSNSAHRKQQTRASNRGIVVCDVYRTSRLARRARCNAAHSYAYRVAGRAHMCLVL